MGERRPSTFHASRSAVLGLVAAALGIRRDEGDALAELDRSYGFASRTDASGALLIDFHTAQGPDEKLLRAGAKAARKAGTAWHRPESRRAELAFRRHELATLLSTRQYRVDALWTVAVWLRPEAGAARWSLEDVAAALRRPRFVPYLGRKSCPLDIPMEPQVIEASDPVRAMAGAVFHTDDLLEPVLARGEGKRTVHWEGTWDGLAPDQTTIRRDRVASRSRWQFGEREEHQKCLEPEGGRHVPEQG